MEEHKPAILIVDDEPINIKMVADVLADRYEIKVAVDGEQALKLLNTFAVDLILLDIQMPRIDGYEVTREIRAKAENSDIPIIFLTSRSGEDSIVKGFEAGGNDYLTKPFNVRELEVRVANHINAYRLSRTVRQQEEFLSFLLDSQPAMVIVTDGSVVQFVNRPLLDFFHCTDLETFSKRHPCICDAFVQSDNFFHLGKMGTHRTWIDAIRALPPEKRVVSMISHADFTEKAFSVAINPFKDFFIVDFHDISETMVQQLELIKKSERDSLTGAYNREYFHRNIDLMEKRHRDTEQQTALAMLDIDHFKQVNDTYGHDVGDIVLTTLVKVIQRTLRKSDTLVRWGGEEFLIVMGISDASALTNVLENLRKTIESHAMKQVGHITCSLGATLIQPREPVDLALKRADVALYDSKSAGRNRVTLRS